MIETFSKEFCKVECAQCGKVLFEVSREMRGVIRKACPRCGRQNIVVKQIDIDMATVHELFTLEITPENFIDSCTESELYEVIMLANIKLDNLNKLRHSEAIEPEATRVDEASKPTLWKEPQKKQ
jgi:phage FluMu protein Com